MPSINDSKCVLVIGATSGIGRALALAIHALPTKPTVIVGGRRKDRLDELVKNGDGRIDAVQVDVQADRETLKQFVDDVLAKHPNLDAVIFASGIQHRFDFKKPEEIDLDLAFDEVNVNYISLFTLIKFFLPHLLKLGAQGHPTFLIPITSGLAIVPGPTVANYSATKAAVHSLGLSLYEGLKGTNVHVIDIIPPLVESELHDHQGTTPMLSKFWMPLDQYTAYTLESLQRGDTNAVVPQMKWIWEKFEKDKLDFDLTAFFSKKD